MTCFVHPFKKKKKKKKEQKRGSRYQCHFLKCIKIFTRFKLSKLHLNLTGKKKLVMKVIIEDNNTEPESGAESTNNVPITSIESFRKQPFKDTCLDI